MGEYVGNYFAGNLQDLRITNGVARYTSNFTPPTAVLPNADVKIYLTARPEVRALRRAKEESGASTASDQDVQATREALERRDHLDSTRRASPLTQSADAIELDTSDLSLDEVIAEVISRVEAGM